MYRERPSPTAPAPVPSLRLPPRHATGFVLILCLLPGCIPDFGTGGTGEWVVPRKHLRRIDPLDLAAYQRPQPPTQGPSTVPAPTTHPADAPPEPTSRPANAPAAELRLSIADVRRLALENNLDLKVDLLDPAIARASLTEEEARFEALFTSNLNFARTDAPVASQLAGSQTSDFHADAGVQIPLRTGGAIQFTMPIERFETNNSFSLLNPAYTSAPAVSITQPLLRGFGPDVNAQRIRIAFYEYQRAEARTKLEVTRVLANVKRAYWRLYAAQEEVKLRQQQYELAYAQFEHAVRQVKAGAVANVEQVRAESGVADQVEAKIVAANDLADRQRELKRIMNAPGLEMESRTRIVPATAPAAVSYRLDGPALASAAMKGRMEMLDVELQIAEETSNVRAARNDLLPLVTLQYTYNVNGLGPSLDEALTQVRQKRFEDHTVGLHIEVPIGNQAAESRLRRAMLNRTQRLATRDQQAAQVRQEVLSAADRLETNWQRILAAQERRRLAARVYEVEKHQFNVGRRTGTEVQDALARLGDARLSEITAVSEYQIAQVNVAFATGTVLGASHVAWQPVVAPDRRMRE